MLGKGLESLIPKKRDDSGQVGSNFSDDKNTRNLDDNTEITDMNFEISEAAENKEYENKPIFSGKEIEIGAESKESFSFELESETESGVYDTGVDKDENRDEAGDKMNISEPVFRIETESIEFNPYQPRKVFNEESLKELAASIREYGILQPLVVSKIEEETDYGTKVRYRLIAGQRRLMAARMLGMSTVPAIIRKTSKDTEPLELAIVENIQREDLNVIERARAYARLSDEFGLTQREIAVRLGKSREYIANALRLLSLPSSIQNALSEGKINESHARILMQVESPNEQEELLRKIISNNLSTRELKKIVDSKKIDKKNNVESNNAKDKNTDPKIMLFEKELSEFLGAPVKVDFHGKSGKIIIHFYSPEEVEGIVYRIKKEDVF